MNEAEAFEAWCEREYGFTTGLMQDEARSGWQAACEWMRSQWEPVFWYRPVGTDGGYEGPIHNWAIEEVRKKSGAWVPLYATPPTAQINEQMLNALEVAETEMRYAGWDTAVPDNLGRIEAYKTVIAALAATPK